MLTYSEYYNRMRGIQSLLNAAADHANINTTGMTSREEVLYIFGKYIQALAAATMPSFFVAKCSMPISILVHVARVYTEQKKFEFSLFDPHDVEQDEELEELWRHDFIDYTRMPAPVIVGAASSIVGMDSVMDLANIDFAFWCNCQAEHLAKYCVAHDVDISKAIDMV